MGLGIFLRRFFVLHFPQWGPDRAANAALAQLIGRLRKAQKSPYDPLTNTFSSPFTGSVLVLQERAARLRAVYRKALGPDEGSRTAAVRTLIWSRMARLGHPPETFLFPGQPPPPVSEGPADWDRTFELKLAAFRSPIVTEAVRGWEQNVRAAELCDFAFGGLISEAPKVQAERLLAPLLDLYYLLPGLAPDRAAADALVDLGTAAGLDTDQAVQTLGQLASLLKTAFDHRWLADVLRCIQEAPFQELREAPPPPEVLGPLVAEVTEAWQTARATFLLVQAEREFQSRLEAAFGGANLVAVTGYDRAASEVLTTHGLPGYRHVRPLRALKNFINLHYGTTDRQALGSFFLEMEFLDNRFKTQLVTAVDTLDRVADQMEQLEEDLQVFLKTRIHPQLEILENNLMGRAAKDALKGALEGLDSQADGLIQDAFSGLHPLTDCLTRIRADWGSRTPDVLGNAAYLAQHASHLRTDLEAVLGHITVLMELLKQVSVDVEEARLILGEGA